MVDDVELVCFDLGRVLIRICDGWPHACRVAGLPAAEGVGSLGRSTVGELVDRLDRGAITARQFADAAAPHLQLTPEQVVCVLDSYLLGPFEGVETLIDDLRLAGVKTACLSNTHEGHWQQMTGTGPNRLPLEKLDFRFASHQMKLRKPEAAIYEQVELQTGVPPGRIVFFDDLSANVDAARARGWQGHVIEPDTEPVTQMRRRLGLTVSR